jgi:prevent-host-death family protein
MKSISVTRARNELYHLLDEVSEGCEPVQITGPRSNAVLVSESDWRSIQETLYLSSVPGMKESIVAGLKAPDEEFSEDPGWDDAGK